MPGHHPKPVYNARIQDMPLLRAYSFRAVCVWLLIVPAMLVSATDWRTPEAQLARKIAAGTGPGAVALTVTNRSFLSSSETDEVRRGLLTELASLGVHSIGEDQAAATVQVSLSENLQNYVWIAEIHVGNNEPSVVMVTGPRTEPAAEEHSTAPLTIHKALLWTDENRILDVALPTSSPSIMIVLEADSVGLYAVQNGRWQVQQTLAIAHANPWPRDLRGRLILKKDHLFDAYLPGVMCQSTAVAPLALHCRASDDPWALAADPSPLNAFYAPARNFFTGVLSPGIQKQTATAPFYSAAALPRDKYTLWVFGATDGQIHLLDGMTDQAVAKLGWGSDLAGVRSGCGLGWQVLAASRDNDASDKVQAFEMADRQAVAASAPVEFGGSITALWADSDSTSVIAVAQNSETGRYEASRLSITCSR
ncbi:MAG TPA: hypothetical protein VKR57_00905 [Terriglobales bacterium]|nr:hypothetical protein [Terriglobales bacterium]